MHLDLLPMLSTDARLQIDELAKHASQPENSALWPLWTSSEYISEYSQIEIQASAQYCAAYDCAIAMLAFGVMCSNFRKQGFGMIYCNDAALHYLELGITRVAELRCKQSIWLLHNQKFWHYCIEAYLHHHNHMKSAETQASEYSYQYMVDEIINKRA